MRILLAPDKFKGSLTAGQVRDATRTALKSIFPDADFVDAPVADGGEGTTEALLSALGGERVSCPASDPFGRPVEAKYGIVEVGDERIAVMEMSAASGFERVLDLEPNPLQATSFGTGQMLLAAAQHRPDRILIGIGGSATNDGGAGMAQALGHRFFGPDNSLLSDLPTGLSTTTRIDPPAAGTPAVPPILVACDVDNPLLGERGATRIYGPQKGVQESDFARFEKRLERLADVVGGDLRELPGAGAAGGLGFGLMAFCGAELKPGFELVAELCHLRDAISQCDLVITGEGSLDSQTLNGKGPAGVAQMARELGRPTVAVCGICDGESVELAEQFDCILPIVGADHPVPVEQAIANASQLIGERIVAASDSVRALVK